MSIEDVMIEELTDDEPESAKEGTSKCELEWFIIKNRNFKNYNAHTKSLISETGVTYKKTLPDGKTEVINKTWSDIEVPYSKGSEYIRVPNQRVKALGKGNFLFKVGINVKADHYQVFTPTGAKVEKKKDDVLRAFRNYDKYLQSEIEKAKSNKETKEVEKEK